MKILRKNFNRIEYSLFDPLDNRWLMTESIPINTHKDLSRVRRSISIYKKGLMENGIFELGLREPFTKLRFIKV